LQPQLLRIGFIFLLACYGTKSGMFPLHSWLPERPFGSNRHRRLPLLSGALLNCALYAIYQVFSNCHLLQTRTGATTTSFGGHNHGSCRQPFSLRQYSLKRLFAYSSIENVVSCWWPSVEFGSSFIFSGFESQLAKVSLFLLSGNIVQATGKKNISQQFGLMASAPVWGVLIALSAFAAIGAPPFGTFSANG